MQQKQYKLKRNVYQVLTCPQSAASRVPSAGQARMLNLVEAVAQQTDGAMADCVFEVSGSAAGVEIMTELPNVRGRIVMVAIHPEPRPINLFKFFWSEIRMIGARLYEEQDFERAIQLAADKRLALDRLITQVLPIEQTQQAFEMIDNNPDGIKYLIDCGGNGQNK